MMNSQAVKIEALWEKRKRAHEIGVSQLNLGQYHLSRQSFQSTICQYGNHVGVLSDLMTSYYYLGDFQGAKSTLELLVSEFSECRTILSQESLFNTLLIIGKMNEELGAVQSAFNWYSDAVGAAYNRESIIRAISNRLRISSFFNITDFLSEDYLSILNKNIDYNFEVEHSLMLAEIVLFGLERSKSKVLMILSDQRLPAADKSLILSDFLDEALRLGRIDLYNAFIPLIEKFELTPSDLFEQAIFNFQKLQITGEIQNKVSLVCRLRIIDLLLRRPLVASEKLELQKERAFLISGLPKESGVLLEKKFPYKNVILYADSLSTGNVDQKMDQTNISVCFNSESAMLHVNGSQICLDRRIVSQKILTAFSERRELLPKDLIRMIWDVGQPSEFDFERLRVNLIRTNNLIKKLIGRNLFEVRKTEVKVSLGLDLIVT